MSSPFKGKEEELILTVQESIAVANLDLKNDLLKENTETNNQILAFQNTILSAPENVELRVKYEKKLSEGRNKLKDIQLEYEKDRTSIIENIKELREKSKKELKKELAVIKKIKNKRKKKSKKNTQIEIKGVLENDTEEQAVKTLQYLLDNKATKDYVDNSIPTELPNPNTLTIKQDGEDDIIYDGSVAKEITLSSGGGDVNLSNYLAKDNETEYTPTEDYNPSTKKYIDDAIQTAIGDVLGGDY